MKLEKILKRSLGIKKGERVLIITDKRKFRIAKKFYDAANRLSEKTYLLIKPVGRWNGEEPSKIVAKGMLNADAVLALTTYSITHTKARIAASRRGVRVATLPGFTGHMFKTLESNPFEMRKVGRKLKRKLTGGKEVRVMTKSGTDLSFLLAKKRMILVDDGLYNEPSSFGNLPAGEVALAPKEGTAKGVIVVDSMQEGRDVYAKKGTAVAVEKGRAVDISDKKCKLAKYFKKIKNAPNIAEFGIGINPGAKVIGSILQDEKAMGTCHVAFGNNTALGGRVYSQIHLDAIMFKPTILVDKKRLL